MRARWGFGLTLALELAEVGCGHRPPPRPSSVAMSVVHDASAVRRVCVQGGLGAPNTGGGSIVFELGASKDGRTIETLRGDRLLVPNPAALCQVPAQPMRICPAEPRRTLDVLAEDAFERSGGRGTTVARGAAVTFYEYVSGGGETKALVDIGGARFVPADEICHPDPPPVTSRATDAFKMNLSVYGGPHAFRPRSTTAIQRIVIHNTEVPLRQTMNTFARLEAITSAHVVIDRDGTVYRVVEDQYAAFHAGASKDALGGFNSTSLGIEVVAFDDRRYGGEPHANASFTDAQRQAVVRLVDFWMSEYGLEIAPEVLLNRSTSPGYADLEYGRAAVTIHRLSKADRGTDCPRLLFPNSPEGDDAFFRWREATFNRGARQARAALAVGRVE